MHLQLLIWIGLLFCYCFFFLFFELGIENVALNAFISSQGWYLSHPTGITFPPRSCRQVICSACRSLQAACYSHMRGYILVVFAEQVCQISARPICSALPWRQMPMWWLCSACIIGQSREKKASGIFQVWYGLEYVRWRSGREHHGLLVVYRQPPEASLEVPSRWNIHGMCKLRFCSVHFHGYLKCAY